MFFFPRALRLESRGGRFGKHSTVGSAAPAERGAGRQPCWEQPSPSVCPSWSGGQQRLGLCGTWSWVLEEGADLPSTLLRSGCLGLLVGFVLFVCSATP